MPTNKPSEGFERVVHEVYREWLKIHRLSLRFYECHGEKIFCTKMASVKYWKGKSELLKGCWRTQKLLEVVRDDSRIHRHDSSSDPRSFEQPKPMNRLWEILFMQKCFTCYTLLLPRLFSICRWRPCNNNLLVQPQHWVCMVQLTGSASGYQYEFNSNNNVGVTPLPLIDSMKELTV